MRPRLYSLFRKDNEIIEGAVASAEAQVEGWTKIDTSVGDN